MIFVISKANHSTSKSMPQSPMLKKQKLPGLWRLTRPSRTNTQKRCPFHHRGLECKSRKSRDTWNNRQVWPWSAKWSRAKANRVLLREHTGHSKHPLPTTQEKFYTWTSQMVNTEIRLMIFFAAEDREALYSQHKQERELTVAQIMSSLLQSVSHSVVSNSLWPMVCPRNPSGKNTGVGCHFLLQGIFPTQGSNSHLLRLLHCRQIFFSVFTTEPPGKPLLQNTGLKKVGKTTWPFGYNLNQIPYDYTVEVIKRFKELDLVDRVPKNYVNYGGL